ncbi:hypothetical protein C806_03407 [Lachnospiraceae bacterium 3-1]|nr:hypothetical protein C806_03407 [Lachnospiraceae bacterium 3-1]
MITLFRFIDLLVTISQGVLLFVIVNSFCHTLRIKCGKWLLPVIFVAFAYFWTWFIVDGTFKLAIQVILVVALELVFYKDSVFNIIASALMGLMIPGSCESLSLTAVGLFTDILTVDVSGIIFASLPTYLTCITVNIIVALCLQFLLNNFRYSLRKGDFVIVLLFELVIFLFYNNSIVHFVIGEYNETFDLIVLLLSTAFLFLFLYLKNNYYLHEQEQRDKVQIAQLKQQYAYYQDKLKDQERIRSIYHDMKNHLLVLEGSQSTDETRKIAQELRLQIADYENYIHTGNDFLDIIIRDKAEKAREKQIDFSAFIDFGGVDFIDPLDISTLFGSGIDNAIEAREKLSEEQRVILVKAGKVQDFVSILIENNCADEAHADGHTTKADKFLHGFGISNMKKAAEKYGGICTTTRENGKFTLKILLPNTDN